MFDGENPPAPNPPGAPEASENPPEPTRPTAGEQDEWPGRMESIRTMVREEVSSQFSGLPDLLREIFPQPSPEKPKSTPPSPAPKAPENPAPPAPQKRRFVLTANPRRRQRG